MENASDRVLGEYAIQQCAVADVALDGDQAFGPFLLRHHVERDHAPPVGQQSLLQQAAEETAAAGQQHRARRRHRHTSLAFVIVLAGDRGRGIAGRR